MRSTRSRFLAFVVVLVAAAEPGFAEGGDGGVVGDGEESGQHLFADVLGEGLALLVAALALALEPVAEHLVKEDGRGAAGENRRAVEGFGHRRFAQRFKALAQIAHGGFDVGLLGQAVDGLGLEGLLAEQIHAIVGARDGDSHEPRQLMRRDDVRALGRGEIVGLVLDGEHDHVLVHVRVVAEDFARVPAPAAPTRRGR